MKTVAQLLHFLNELPESTEYEGQKRVAHLSVDSRIVQANDCFIALQGERVHGLDFLETVLSRHPAMILSDKQPDTKQQALLEANTFTSWIVKECLAEYLPVLTDWFYDQPSQRIKVVGITGTNGKTSTAFYTAQLLEGLGQKTALIGTLGNGMFHNGAVQSLATTVNTTPDVVTVHRLLAEFIAQGANWVIMEVSSHALELGRVKGVMFDTVALTHVTRDHIDFHGSLKAYQQAKKKLFTDYPARVKVLNVKDAVGKELFETLSQKTRNATRVWGYALMKPLEKRPLSCDLCCEKLTLTPYGMSLELTETAFIEGGGDFSETVFIPLMGAFNAENVLCALSIILSSTLACEPNRDKTELWAHLATLLPMLQAVEGRMQPVTLSEQCAEQCATCPTVIVDFAHTPDALQQVLAAVKQHLDQSTLGKLWVVFGCGGDRDQGKRPLMAQAAEPLADCIMVTSDNPRFEAPEQIIKQIMTGFTCPHSVKVTLNRKEAIEQVLDLARPEDVVFIAGKGHESYQEIKGVKTPFQDEQVVLNWVQFNNMDKPLGEKDHGGS